MPSDIKIIPYSTSQHQEFSWGNLTWFANRALGNSDEMTVGRCILKPGRTNGRHYHPNCCEILVVIEGRIRHTITEDQETDLGEGDTVTVDLMFGTVPPISAKQTPFSSLRSRPRIARRSVHSSGGYTERWQLQRGRIFDLAWQRRLSGCPACLVTMIDRPDVRGKEWVSSRLRACRVVS